MIDKESNPIPSWRRAWRCASKRRRLFAIRRRLIAAVIPPLRCYFDYGDTDCAAASTAEQRMGGADYQDRLALHATISDNRQKLIAKMQAVPVRVVGLRDFAIGERANATHRDSGITTADEYRYQQGMSAICRSGKCSERRTTRSLTAY